MTEVAVKNKIIFTGRIRHLIVEGDAVDTIRFSVDRMYNDIDLQNAIADDDLTTKETAIKYRDYLRDLPEQLENLSVEDMKKKLKELKIL